MPLEIYISFGAVKQFYVWTQNLGWPMTESHFLDVMVGPEVRVTKVRTMKHPISEFRMLEWGEIVKL